MQSAPIFVRHADGTPPKIWGSLFRRNAAAELTTWGAPWRVGGSKGAQGLGRTVRARAGGVGAARAARAATQNTPGHILAQTPMRGTAAEAFPITDFL